MSKRPASTGISCPGCTTNFDAGAHFPLIGSCAHSLCSACVNEKKITSCPICRNPGGFMWKQKNELATQLLAILNGKGAKKPRLEAPKESENANRGPFAALFDPENKSLLARVVNKFEPIDFVNFAMTCSEMKNFCLTDKEIQIIYDDLYVKVDLRNGAPRFGVAKASDSLDDDFMDDDELFPQNYRGTSGGFFNTPKNRKKLRKAPFVFKVDTLNIDGIITPQALLEIRSFLSEFPVESIDELNANGITDWNGFTKLLMYFKPRILEIYALDEGDTSIPDATVNYILQNTVKFICDLPICDRIILESPSNVTLELRRSSISKETFEDLVVKCARSNEDIDWNLGCRKFQFDVYGVFKKVLSFDHEGRVSKKRPLAFVKENEPCHFYILRKDGKVVHCIKSVKGAHFVMLAPKDYPPCLQNA